MAEITNTELLSNLFSSKNEEVVSEKAPERDKSTDKTVENEVNNPERDNKVNVEATEDSDTAPEEGSLNEAIETTKSIEDKARETGWSPKDQWKGDPDEWVDAKEYIARGSFFKKIAKYKQEVEEQKQTLQEVLKTLAISEERAYKKALKEIEQGKLQAKSNKDVDAFEAYVKQEQDLTKNYDKKIVDKASKSDVKLFETKEFKEFALTDPYILKQDLLTDFARHTAQKLSNEWAQANPGITDIKAELDYIKANMRKIHPPERFPELYRESEQAPSAARVSSAKAGTTATKTASQVSTQGLTDMQLNIVNKLKRDGLDWKTYVKEVKANQ